MRAVETPRWPVRAGIRVVCHCCAAPLVTDGSEGVQPHTFRVGCPECGTSIIVTNYR